MISPPKQQIKEYITLEVTTRCDSSCTYCFALPGKENLQMDFKTASAIADEAYEIGYRKIHLTGGEPFLWPELENFLEYAVSLGYEVVYINTGGRFLNKAKSLIERYRNVLKFSVTLNGPREIHTLTRPENSGGNSYDSVTGFISYIDSLQIPYHIFTVITRPLLPKLSHFSTGLFVEYPNMSSHTWIQLHRGPGDTGKLHKLILSPDEFIQTVHTACILSSFKYKIRFLDNPLASVVAKKLGFEMASPPLVRSARLTVQVNGNMTSAHSSRKIFNKYNQGLLKSTLNSKNYTLSVQENVAECSKCSYLNGCRNSGMIHPSEKFRDYNESKPFCVRVNSLLNLANN